MASTIPLASSHVIDWEAISAFADEEIIHAPKQASSLLPPKRFDIKYTKPAASPRNIVGTFRIAGIWLALQDGTLVCEVAPKDARRVFMRIDTIIEEEDGGRLERELYIEHCAEALTCDEVIRPESIMQQFLLIWLWSER
jgi:hypothetical protein